jgi:hypothetical protein
MKRAKKEDFDFQIQIFHKLFGIRGIISDREGMRGQAARIQ